MVFRNWAPGIWSPDQHQECGAWSILAVHKWAPIPFPLPRALVPTQFRTSSTFWPWRKTRVKKALMYMYRHHFQRFNGYLMGKICTKKRSWPRAACLLFEGLSMSLQCDRQGRICMLAFRPSDLPYFGPYTHGNMVFGWECTVGRRGHVVVRQYGRLRAEMSIQICSVSVTWMVGACQEQVWNFPITPRPQKSKRFSILLDLRWHGFWVDGLVIYGLFASPSVAIPITTYPIDESSQYISVRPASNQSRIFNVRVFDAPL